MRIQSEPYAPDGILAAALRVRKGRDLFLDSRSPIAEATLVAYLFHAIDRVHPKLEPYKHAFVNRTKDKTLENAIGEMTTAYASLCDQDTIGGGNPQQQAAAYAATAAQTSPTTKELEATVAELKAELHKIKSTLGGSRQPKTAKAAAYCWIHGLCGHQGSDCRQGKENPPDGFVCGPNVTWANRATHGGSSKDWGAEKHQN